MNNLSSADPNHLVECYRVVDDIIDNLDDRGLNQFFGGGMVKDIDTAISDIVSDVYGVMFTGNINIDFRPNYVDNLTDTIEDALRKENLNYFISSVLPEFEMNWHHIEWGDLIMGCNKLGILASRDHGKSYFFSNAYPIWQLYRYRTPKASELRRPNMKNVAANRRGFLFSFSLQQAVDLLEILKNTISENPILNNSLHPGSTKDGWAKTDITCKNGARLTVRGFGSSVRGAHPGWIIIDDPLKDNTLYSSVQRKKGIDYFHSVIMNMITPGGKVVGVGTPFHSNDLWGDLKTKSGWVVREYPGIFPDGRVLWPRRWDYKGLVEKRETQGSMIFSREILCRPVTNESTIFPPEIVNRAFLRMEDFVFVKNRDSYAKKFQKVVTGCDFSISSSVGADYTVFITCGVDEDERLWLMNFVRFKGKTFNDQIAVLKSIHSNFRPDVMMLESNVFQQIFLQETERQGLPVVGHNTGTEKYDFKMGLPGLALAFERGLIKIPRGNQEAIDICDMFSLELSSVTWTDKGLEGVGEHDDIAMALWQTYLASKYAGGFRFSFM